MGRAPAKPTPWRALAEQLADEGCESIYLTRLRAQHDVRAHVDTLAEEVAEEQRRKRLATYYFDLATDFEDEGRFDDALEAYTESVAYVPAQVRRTDVNVHQ